MAIEMAERVCCSKSPEELVHLLCRISVPGPTTNKNSFMAAIGTQALQAWPGNVKACFRKGAAQMRLALPAAACVSFQRGLQFAPGHRSAL